MEIDRAAGEPWYLQNQAWNRGTVFLRIFADHAPINYVSACLGLRG